MSIETTKQNFNQGDSGLDVIFHKVLLKQESKMSIETAKMNFGQGDSGRDVIFIKYC